MTGSVVPAPAFDPWSPEFVAWPYDVFADLRQNAPIWRFERTGQWVFSRHADVDALLRDRRLGRTYLHVATHEEMGHQAPPDHLEPFWTLNNNGMLDREPPDHTRLRRLVSKAFTPRTVERLAPRVREFTDQLVDNLLDAGSDGSPVDLISTVAEPLPVAVIAEMLGIPDADRHLLRPWSADICGMYELNPSAEAEEKAIRASVEFTEYLVALAAERRKNPGDDLISALASVADAGDQLTDPELVGTCVLLLNAGHEATVNVTGNGWWALFRNPDELARLRAGEVGYGTAIEELMRWDTPLQLFERWVLEDIEVHGVRIPRGEEVALLFGSANRDPEVFADAERLDLGRSPNPHISFSAGIHYCLGAPLARLELATSFETMVRRVPNLALAETPRWKGSFVIRGLDALQVTV
ncbi:cytochrome P450 [Cryptosporangium aurantiacum]|uniref:Cytochrome P450 n=1 Tax=Cryptosporangium aurantiacum TaxID=134849 RepID=A0A1M7NBL0_9ACTN|nr:cytochrome P450 [Cryptosporangium aurantiacum]SHN01073.1 Cytochrome P450 [Cryptosporangium aurantiacum]